MKIIFLDIDGVLNSQKFLDAGGNQKQTKFPEFVSKFIDCHAVSLLKQIVDATNAKIVISSTWKNGVDRTPEWFVDLFNTICGIQFDVIDKTPLLDTSRGEEIKAWLDNNHVDNFVIIDDDGNDFLDEQKHKLVQTTFENGLTEKEVDEAITILNMEKNND